MEKIIFKGDGIVLLNKEKGITSFGAVNRLKKMINAQKAGHAGTLDPSAEGLLIILLNGATKFSENLMKKNKEYLVEMELGYETDTYDSEGEVTKRYGGEIAITEEDMIETLRSFQGEIEQVPPMYSAIKIKGEKLYELARKGIEIERSPRKVKIHSINEISFNRENGYKISFFARVSSGTYIRSLVRDVGEKLGVYGTMTRLVRTRIDKFNLSEAVTFGEVEGLLEEEGRNNKGIIQEKLKKAVKFKGIEDIFDWEKITVSEEKYRSLKNGMTVIVSFKKFREIGKVSENGIYSIYTDNSGTGIKEFKGLGKVVRIGHDKVYMKRDRYFL